MSKTKRYVIQLVLSLVFLTYGLFALVTGLEDSRTARVVGGVLVLIGGLIVAIVNVIYLRRERTAAPLE